MKPLTLIICLTIIAALVIGTCGCTNPTTQSQTSQVEIYGKNFLDNAKAKLGPNETLTSSTLVKNGTDAVRLSYTTVNKTASVFTPNGTTATYNYNIKQFSNKDGATKFYNQSSFGYTPYNTSTAPKDPTYRQTTGRDATINNVALRIDSFAFVTSKVSYIMQQDEFVTWGTASVMPK